ncbi:MAG: hypothetical protein COV31_02520 [Candidatus Yanofskybacteria bacterium CG10_big_fil_rev_8_21_14_0_10_46_23]|uniref:Uncharacterized protein n=1 Tax=Candidatus Yanofskybacteria bacterium CG10_big_fil_rev_8_21_14_0_10_46_23 TaxID=1975098 RepID=A0A2H0R616_9BACT|nr:MAG: hypothetical protein COV31_02520 [Candidatus Yanofskybacteria bacterium CG10_big_fil_rev_8_21_14_0_10_46_23]
MRGKKVLKTVGVVVLIYVLGMTALIFGKGYLAVAPSESEATEDMAYGIRVRATTLVRYYWNPLDIFSSPSVENSARLKKAPTR